MLPQASLTQAAIFNLLKEIVEIGGIYKVNDKKYIVKTVDDAPVLVTGEGSKHVPILVFNDMMTMGEHVILNPFQGNFGDTPEQHWFTTFMNVLPGMLIQQMIEQGMAQVLWEAEKKPAGEPVHKSLKISELMAPWASMIDAKTITEIGHLKGSHFGRIHYSKANKTATLKIEILNESVEEEYSSIRKKTWKILRGIIGTLVPKAVTSQSVLVSCPKLDATLQTLIHTLEPMAAYVEGISGAPVPVESLKRHVLKMNDYFQFASWCTGLVKPAQDDAKAPFGAPTVTALGQSVMPVVAPITTGPTVGVAVRPIGTITAGTVNVGAIAPAVVYGGPAGLNGTVVGTGTPTVAGMPTFVPVGTMRAF